jgi:PEP-CTERM motif
MGRIRIADQRPEPRHNNCCEVQKWKGMKMLRATKFGLMAGAWIASAGTASADTITQTFTFGPAPVNGPAQTLNLNLFNPALGTLTAVTITGTETITGSADVTNPAPAGPPGNGEGFGVTFLHEASAIQFALDLDFVFFDQSNTVSGFLAGNTSSGTLLLSGTNTATDNVNSGSVPDYEGLGTASVAINDGDSLSDVILNGLSANLVNDGTLTESFVYTYTPITTAVPEPGSLTLMGSALFGFGWLRRRKPKKT